MCRSGSTSSPSSSSPPSGAASPPLMMRSSAASSRRPSSASSASLSSSSSSVLLAATKLMKLPFPATMPRAHHGRTSVPLGRFAQRILSVVLSMALLLCIWLIWQWDTHRLAEHTTVIVVTPTHKRPERLADMTRFAQTLMHVPDLHWIVIEDANETVPAVERILQRSRIPYTYFFATTAPGFPKRGWTHRNVGLQYIREHYAKHGHNAVVYFADDDNTYDIRLFELYIKRVRTIGIWAVGLAGAALVEAPHVVNGTITAWDVVYAPQRRFAVDMAGFAINLRLILSSPASFNLGCVRYSPESCFLAQFGIPREKVEPFGWNDSPKEILVWHTKTKNIGTKGSDHGYVVEQ